MKKNKASTTVSHVFLFYWNNAKTFMLQCPWNHGVNDCCLNAK